MVSTLPEGPDWTYEIKLDGYRAQVLCDGETTQLLSRNGKDLGHRFPALVVALASAAPHGSILDGELVALDASGRPSFSLIQNSATSEATFVFFAFDLLQLEGVDLTRKSLSERRRLLHASLRQSEAVQLSESVQIPAKQMLEMVRGHGLEGVVAKRLSSTYEGGSVAVPGPRCGRSFPRSWSSEATRPAPTASMPSWLASTEAIGFSSVPASAMVSCRLAVALSMTSSRRSKQRYARLRTYRKQDRNVGDKG